MLYFVVGLRDNLSLSLVLRCLLLNVMDVAEVGHHRIEVRDASV